MSISGGADHKTTKERTKSTKEESGRRTSQLQLEDEAVQKIIEDVLGGANGIASIFAGEQNSGIFDSSVANQASGDLAANLVGELAKITGKTVEEEESTSTLDSLTRGSEISVSADGSFTFV